MVDTLSQDDAVAGDWDADHHRPRTRNCRHSNAQCTKICISKCSTFSLRTSILLLASVTLAPNRHFSQITPVAPLCDGNPKPARNRGDFIGNIRPLQPRKGSLILGQQFRTSNLVSNPSKSLLRTILKRVKEKTEEQVGLSDEQTG